MLGVRFIRTHTMFNVSHTKDRINETTVFYVNIDVHQLQAPRAMHGDELQTLFTIRMFVASDSVYVCWE